MHLSLCWASFGYYAFGSFHDDAVYWVAAKAVSLGRYHFLANPYAPPLISHPPGYPLLAAPLAAICFDCPWLGQALSIAFSCLALIFFWKLCRMLVPAPWNHVCTAWMALHPMVTRYASTTLAEPLFACLSLGALLFYCSQGGSRKGTHSVLLGVLAGGLMLARTAGIAMAAALLADLALKKSWKKCAQTGASILAVTLPWSLWTQAQSNHASAHLAHLKDIAWSLPVLLERLKDSIFFYAGRLTIHVFFPVAPLEPALFNILLWGLAAAFAVCVLTALSCLHLAQENNRARALSFYAVFYLTILLVWPRSDLRYLYPFLPIAGLLFFRITGRFSRQGPKMAAVCALTAVISLATSLRATAQQILEIRRHQNPSVPVETLAWMKKNLPAHSVVASASAATVYFYARFQGIEFPRVANPQELTQSLRQTRANFILLEGSLLGWSPRMPPMDPTNWTPYVAQAIQTTRCCPLLYANETEKTWLYRLR